MPEEFAARGQLMGSWYTQYNILPEDPYIMPSVIVKRQLVAMAMTLGRQSSPY